MKSQKLLLCFFLLLKYAASTGQIHVSGSLCSGIGGVQGADCSTSTLFFDMNTDPTIDGWRWDFGDGGFSTERNAQHNYANPGSYTVRLQHFKNGTPADIKTQIIEISDFPQPLLKGETNGKYDEKCAGPLKLDPFEGRSPPSGAKYKWFPEGETTRTIEVENSGCYSVEVTNDKGCSKTVSINVEFCLAGPNQGPSPQGWYFGVKAGIEFTPKVKVQETDCDIDPTKYCDLLGQEDPQTEGIDINPITSGNELEAQDASAMVYNKAGALVLYASGTRIYDVNDDPVGGGSSMSGSNNIPQSTVIVPRKICYECPSHQYYVLTLNAQTGVLYYNLVDIRGQKQVIEQNIPLATNMAGRITAVETPQGDYRVVTHDDAGNTFRFFDIGSRGVVESEVSIGSAFTTAEMQNGVMKFSEQKTHFAVAFVQGGRNIVELYTFNAQNQALSFVRRIDFGTATGNSRIYGLEFSPQDAPPQNSPPGTQAPAPTYIYATIGSQVHRAGVRTPSNPQVLFSDPDGVKLGSMLIGPPQGGFPKSIVVARGGESSVHAIDFPETNSPVFRAKTSQTRGIMGLGLPEITRPTPESAGAGMVLKYRGRCAGSPTNFQVQPMCADKAKPIYNWDFGDGEKAITYAIPTVNHTYQKPGTYTLKLRIRIPNCGEREYEAQLIIHPTPEVTVPGLIPYCDLPDGIVNIEIDPKPIGGNEFKFEWKRGLGTNLGTTPTIIATAIDKYAVRIVNEKRCETTKTLEIKQVCQPEIYVPEIFTPNVSDLVNERFRFFPYFVSDLKVRIYNRWGEQVFSSEQKENEAPIIGFSKDNIDTISDLFWNGKFRGEEAPPGTYAYEIEYVEAFTLLKRVKTQKGSVLLVR